MYKAKIVEESEERMVIRSSYFDVLIAYGVIVILVTVLIVAIQQTLSKEYDLLILVPFSIIAIVLVSFSEGRLLNTLCIDKRSGIITIRRIGPWLPGKKIFRKINQITELCFVQSDFFLRTDKFLIFVVTGEERSLEKRWSTLRFKIVLRDLWWPVYKKMPEDILEKHREIARFLGVPYRRRLVTFKGYMDEIE